jgi:lipoprotein-anchoring transpeptidase ErfK/SrfK
VTTTTSEPPPVAKVSAQPADGATDVGVTAPVRVAVTNGALDQVALANADGKQIAGTLSPDKLSWAVGEPLGFGRTYTWSGSATGTDGKKVPVTGSFTTVQPAKQVRGMFNIGDDQTVGVAASIIIQFDAHLDDKAAAEKALSVQSTPATAGGWAWLPDENGGSRVHWRPKDYWQSGTKVTVSAKLYGVPYGGGAYGRADATSTFTIGRAQIVRADVNSHQLVIIRDGTQVAGYPASYGLDSDPDRNTRSGIHVVSEKFTDQRMVSQQYGYDVVEKWAVRMSNNGEFIHANPATSGVQGSTNVSHGCVNLSLDNAKAYFDTATYGDPVEVTGSGVQLSARDGDIYDWTVSWPEWQAASALK